jgi:hypothetical protein
MTQKEFGAWVEYYSLYPFDDYHRRYRPAALIARSMSGAEMGDLLEWLQPIKQVDTKYSEADMATFKAFGITPPRRA